MQRGERDSVMGGRVSEGGELGGRRELNEGKDLGEAINWKGAWRSHLFV